MPMLLKLSNYLLFREASRIGQLKNRLKPLTGRVESVRDDAASHEAVPAKLAIMLLQPLVVFASFLNRPFIVFCVGGPERSGEDAVINLLSQV